MSTKSLNRAEHLRQQHRAAAQSKRTKRRRQIALGVTVAVIGAAAVIGIVVGTLMNRSPGHGQTPPNVTGSGGIIVGAASAPVHVVAYEDPQCPVCGRFESGNGKLLNQAVIDGKVSVEYRMRSFLGPESVRAVNALAAAHAAGRFDALRQAMYAHQPPEGSGGYTAKDLLDLASGIGLSSRSFTDSVRNMSYEAWVRRIDDQASRDGNVATPSLLVDGHQMASDVMFDPSAFKHALGLS